MRVLPGASGFSYARDGFEKPLLAIMAMSGLVLLIAVVNVASLLLVRGPRVGYANSHFVMRWARTADGLCSSCYLRAC